MRNRISLIALAVIVAVLAWLNIAIHSERVEAFAIRDRIEASLDRSIQEIDKINRQLDVIEDLVDQIKCQDEKIGEVIR